MTKLACLLATGVLAMLTCLPFTARAHAEAARPIPGPSLSAPLPRDTAPDEPPQRLRLSIDRFTPQIVTGSTKQLTVTGSVTNIGDRDISDIEVRLQAGERITSDVRFATQLASPANPSRAASGFQPVSAHLAPGQSVDMHLTVSLSTLKIAEHGIYPLLINVNGSPDYGGRARLASITMLLPVRAVSGGQGPVAGGQPTPLGMLWPLAADHPRLLPTAPGARPLLSDDELTRSLSSGGRLFGLVDVAKRAIARHPRLASTLCFAIDPALLDTVNAMATGYQVRARAGHVVVGKGQDVAASWLAELRALTSGRCVLPMPYATTDLVALSRAGADAMERPAVNSGVLRRTLPDAHLLTHVVWPAGGTLDQRTLSDLVDAGTRTVLVDPRALGHSDATTPLPISGVSGSPQPAAVRLAPLISEGLGGLTPQTPSLSGQDSATDGGEPVAVAREPKRAAAVPGLAVQNGLAALMYRTQLAPQADQPALVAPPKRWHATAHELSLLLSTVNDLFNSGSAVPYGLDKQVNAPVAEAPVALRYSPRSAASEIPPKVAGEVPAMDTTLRNLREAMSKNDATGATPAQVIDPYRFALLRAMSCAWRDTPGGQARHAARMLAEVGRSIEALTSEVSISDPGRPITLASADSPLPVSVNNDLPVGISVRVTLLKATGLKITPVSDKLVPAHSGRTLYIATEALRSGWFNVDVRVTTPDGTQLGTMERFELRSSSYGTITIAVTATAFGLLVLLSSRRIYRRVSAARSAKNGHTVHDDTADTASLASPESSQGR